MKDLVSIIMPSYNTGKYITKSVESVLQQTYPNWELLIIDDGSTDETDEVIKDYKDARIKYHKNQGNCGAAVSRNWALRKAKGKWIAFLDSDDLWKIDKLEKQIKFMKENEYYFSYTKYIEINETGEVNGKIMSGPRKIGKTGMYNYCWPGCLTVMYDAEKIGLIQIKNIRKNNDYAMWLQIIQKADCFLLPEVMALYRKRQGSISNNKYTCLIQWHYRLFKENEENGVCKAILHTIRNLFFGLLKKIIYVKQVPKRNIKAAQ